MAKHAPPHTFLLIFFLLNITVSKKSYILEMHFKQMLIKRNDFFCWHNNHKSKMQRWLYLLLIVITKYKWTELHFKLIKYNNVRLLSRDKRSYGCVSYLWISGSQNWLFSKYSVFSTEPLFISWHLEQLFKKWKILNILGYYYLYTLFMFIGHLFSKTREDMLYLMWLMKSTNKI